VAPRTDGPAFGDDVATITAHQPDALAPQLDRPVFTDDTGRRAGVLQWGSRGFCLMGAVLCAALAVTLQTRVLLPSLEKAFLASTEGIAAAAGISDTSSARVAPLTKLRGDPSEIGAAGQRIELSEPTFDTAATDQPLATVPATEQRAQRVARTRAVRGSESHTLARTRAVRGSESHTLTGTPKRDASAPTTAALHRSAKVGAGQGLPASRAKRLAAAKAHKSSAVNTRSPRAAPKMWKPRSANPGSGVHGRPTTVG
jgi:hypothetical protein